MMKEEEKQKSKVPQMNVKFARLNPIVVPENFSNAKTIGIIMNKLACNQYPTSIIPRNKEIQMMFDEKPGKSMYISPGNNDLRILLKKDPDDFCEVVINLRDSLFRVEYKKDIYSTIDTENPFLQHAKEESKFTLTARSFLRFISEFDESGNEVKVFQTGNNFYSFIKFFEDSINNKVVTLCMIQNFNNALQEVNLSIADFCKMCKNSFMEDISLPKQKSVNKLIDDLIYMAESKIEKIQAGILRITRTFGKWGTCRIYLGGTVVCNEYSLSRFRYTFHPGIQLVAKYLEFYDKIKLINHKIQKEMFKKL